MDRVAVIDLGSNSVRMTITRVNEDGSHHMVESARAMVRLSEGMGDDALLQPVPMTRTLEALDMFTRLMKVHQSTHIYPVATAAVRQAKNSEGFLKAIGEHTGLKFDVISGEEEAELDFLGVANTIPLQDYAMIDVGGASTEIAVIRARKLIEKTSLPWGAVNLTEQFELSGKRSRKKVAAAEAAVTALLRFCTWLPKDPSLPLVGLGGTIRAIAKADRRRRGYPLQSLHQYELPASRMSEWLSCFTGSGGKSRQNVPGIGRDRAELMPGAVIPLRQVMEHLGSQRVIISGNGIREGLFYRHLGKALDWPESIMPDVRAHAVINMMRLHDADKEHSYHVRMLSLLLFDRLLPLHGLGAEARALLADAALLHDVGMHLDYYNHHQHAYYLLLHCELNGFSHRERVLLALLCGMHRVNSELRMNLDEWNDLLQEGDRMLLRRLSIFLMLAEQLDRSESGAVTSIDLEFDEAEVSLQVRSERDVRLELDAAAGCVVPFRKEFGRLLFIGQMP